MLQPSLFLTPFPRHGFAFRALPWPFGLELNRLFDHLQYYGASDCRRPFSPRRRLSPLTALYLPIVPPPTTQCAPIPLSTTTAYRATSGLRHGIAGSPQHNAESSSSSYGPTVRLRLLPTSPHGDAVTFGYGAVANSDTDLHRADLAPSRAHDSRLRGNDRDSIKFRFSGAECALLVTE
jgi:hypothetical protein